MHEGEEQASASEHTRIILRVYEAGADILRETTDLATGHVSVESMGWADVRQGVIPEETKGQLSEAELTYVELRLQELKRHMEQRDRADAFMLHADINRVRVWLQSASEADVESIGEQLMFELQELRRLLMQRLGK